MSSATVPHDTSVTEPRRHRPLRVFVSDPAELVRQGIRTTLARQRDIAVVGESVGGPSTSEIAANLAPNVVLLGADRILPDTLETVKAIGQQVSGCRVILLVGDASVPDVVDAAAAGARGVLFRSGDAGSLAEAIRLAVGGHWALDPGLLSQLMGHLAERARAPTGLGLGQLHPSVANALTPREREVLLSTMEGQHNDDIAKALGVSKGTVKTHLRSVYRKLGTSSRTAAALRGLRGLEEDAA